MIGKPGSGKGSISNVLKKEFDVTHLSIDLLKNKVKNGTSFNETEKQNRKLGRLYDIPTFNQNVVEIVESAVVKNEKSGFILDGLPRTTNQAEMLQEALKRQNKPITRVFELSVDDSILE